jgi:coatomer protein complex subunit alpha (xenin)
VWVALFASAHPHCHVHANGILDPLAYMTAKAHGLDDECKLILDASGLTEDQVTLPSIGKPVDLPRIIVPTHKANWPVKSASHSVFEKVLLGEVDGLEDPGAAATNGFGAIDEMGDDEDVQQNGHRGLDEEDEAAGWDMGDDINVEVEADAIEADNAEVGAGSSEADIWARNSPIAADHAAAGSFETAMQLLNRQVAAVNFDPLKPRFLEIYQASKTYLPASAGLPPLVNYVRRTVDETDLRKVLPILPRDLEMIASVDLQEGYGFMRSNKLDDGLKTFKRILHSLLVNAVSSQKEVEDAKKIIASASEYAIAMAMELERRSIGTEGEANLRRSLELSAYFTIPKLEVAHRQLALMAAMKLAASNKNFSSALSFANRMIANGGSPKLLEQVCILLFKPPLIVDMLTTYRQGRSKPSVNGVHRTRSTSNSISLQSSTCAQRRIRRSTTAHPV